VGWYTGPTTQFEISDDGKGVARLQRADELPWYLSGSSNCSYPAARAALRRDGDGSTTDRDEQERVHAHDVDVLELVHLALRVLSWSQNNQSVVFWAATRSTTVLVLLRHVVPVQPMMSGPCTSTRPPEPDGGDPRLQRRRPHERRHDVHVEQPELLQRGLLQRYQGACSRSAPSGATTAGSSTADDGRTDQRRRLRVPPDRREPASTTVNSIATCAASRCRGDGQVLRPHGDHLLQQLPEPNGAFQWGAGNDNNKVGSQISVAARARLRSSTRTRAATVHGDNDSTTTFSAAARRTPRLGRHTMAAELIAFDANVAAPSCS